jgi:hypothetical protein
MPPCGPLDSGAGSTMIEARGTTHCIDFGVDHIRQEPKITRMAGPAFVQNGTRITFSSPVQLGQSSSLQNRVLYKLPTTIAG